MDGNICSDAFTHFHFGFSLLLPFFICWYTSVLTFTARTSIHIKYNRTDVFTTNEIYCTSRQNARRSGMEPQKRQKGEECAQQPEATKNFFISRATPGIPLITFSRVGAGCRQLIRINICVDKCVARMYVKLSDVNRIPDDWHPGWFMAFRQDDDSTDFVSGETAYYDYSQITMHCTSKQIFAQCKQKHPTHAPTRSVIAVHCIRIIIILVCVLMKTNAFCLYSLPIQHNNEPYILVPFFPKWEFFHARNTTLTYGHTHTHTQSNTSTNCLIAQRRPTHLNFMVNFSQTVRWGFRSKSTLFHPSLDLHVTFLFDYPSRKQATKRAE